MPTIKLIVDGGNMKPGPAVAQQLGPMGVNLGKVIEDVNHATSGFAGVKVPVEIDVDKITKKFTIKVFSPPVAELLKKELKLEKGSGQSGKVMVSNVAIEKLIGIAKTKHQNMLAKDLKAALKLVVGSCVSLGVMVENKNAKEVVADIDSGKYDSEINEGKVSVAPEKQKELDANFAVVKAKQDKDAKALEEAKAAEEAAKAAAAAAAPQAAAPVAGKAPVAKAAEAKKK